MTCYGSAAAVVVAAGAMSVAYTAYMGACTALNAAATAATGGAAAPAALVAEAAEALTGLIIAGGVVVAALVSYVECLQSANDPKAAEVERRLRALEEEQHRYHDLQQRLLQSAH
jgi:hypothetical protein